MSSPRTHTPRAGNPAYQASTRALSTVNETNADGLVVDVQNGQAFTAVIVRRNRGGRLEWCLPKSYLEGAETSEQAAVHGTMGETRITGRVLRHLVTTDCWFTGREHRVHKVMYRFLLEAVSGTPTTENDPDHEAKDVERITLDDVSHRLAYPSEHRIIITAQDILVGDE